MPSFTPPFIKTLLFTGAAGGLGKALRPKLANFCEHLRLSDVNPVDLLEENEEFIACDLSQKDPVLHLCNGVDAILHFGGISLEGPFEPILESNIRGSYHIYEAARQHGIKRIVFASSNHVTGFYSQDEIISINSPRRPDGFYAISKSFTEDLARYYYDRWGIETLCIRIGSSFPKPKDERMLSTWLSYDDLIQLISLGLSTPNLGHQVIYGVSDNTPRWWSTEGTEKLNFHPLHNTDALKEEIEKLPPLPFNDPQRRYQGGAFTALGPYDGPKPKPIEAISVAHERNRLGESPIWSPKEGYVYWVDIEAHRIYAYNPETQACTYWITPQPVTALFPEKAKDNQWLICAKNGIYRTKIRWGEKKLNLQLLAPFHSSTSSMRLNDAIMDTMGRIWVSSIDENQLFENNKAAGELFCWSPLDPTALIPKLKDLKIGNGLAINPEQNKLYISDSHPSRKTIYTYDLDLPNGTLSNKTLFATLKTGQGRPDGAAIDELGGYWVCGIDAGVIHRFTPDGVLERSIYLPICAPTKLCFGGHDLATIYITHRSADESSTDSGVLFKAHPGVKGLSTSFFYD